MIEKTKPETVDRTLVHVVTVASSLIFLRGHSEMARARGWTVHGFSAPPTVSDNVAKLEPMKLHYVSMVRKISPFRDVVSVLHLVFKLRKIAPEIVHAHTPKGGLIGILAAWIAQVPRRVYHVHGLPIMTARGGRAFLLGAAERLASTLATHVISVSNSVREEYIRRGFASAEHIFCLADGSINGVDCDAEFCAALQKPERRRQIRELWGASDETIVIGFVGRIARDKGIEVLADAWRIVRQEHEKSVLVIIGPIDDSDPISHERLGELQQQAIMLGAQSNLPELYNALDIFVLPTFREGLPGVLLEAAAMQLPIVATAASGCIDVIKDGITGTLVPVDNASALASAILMYAGSPDLRRNHGTAARNDVSNRFSRRDVICRHLDFIDSLCSRI